ncbi:Ankyrin repeat protein [Aspergillus fischeri NRRL 181]|uniref:Ankyrin repeat protein n=1 Tax=Neosartorya fischeri (strain ATCC 1020 / DSM 3700 / CBS 544.65 / FGSC A1164 / JCM 1740 / NRRL 181 / WB 181) TaxID=331117 RepID=A1CVU7_NEOFI|nr:Ankyrin repeat protein [Aspergillus fischeri NRRL 181]EAW24749.1 Ankyrin repeat protein [Aspergillus fischeri NRRL 181]
MPVDRPNMDDTQIDQPSPPPSVPGSEVSEDESLADPQLASTEGRQSWDRRGFRPPLRWKSLREAVLRSGRNFISRYEIEWILENEQVDVDEKDADGRTLLSRAIENDQYYVVEVLLNMKADPNTREEQNSTPFFWATSRSQYLRSLSLYNDMIKLLLQKGADPNLTNDEGNTPLALAAAEGNEEFVKLVVESGRVKINTQGDEEKTPLMCAATGGWPDCMGYLLQLPTDMGSCAWWERYLQTRSRRRQKEPKKKTGPSNFSKSDPGYYTGLRNLILQVKSLSLLDKVLPEGRTFLSWAVEFEDEEIVKLLLGLKANPNVRDEMEHQMTPLIKALKLGNMDMVNLLMEKDKYSMHILVDEADDMGEEQALELARKLLGQGYDLNKRNWKGQNPVHIACHKGRKRFVEEFLHPDYGEQNAFVHGQDNSGKTNVGRGLRYS